MAKHALLSPSGAHRWIPCPGSAALEKDLPNDTSSYADEGTAAHQLASWVLESGAPSTKAYMGRVISIMNGVYWPGGKAPTPPKLKGHNAHIHRQFTVDNEMADNVQTYVDNVRRYAEGNTLLVEQRVSIEHVTGEPDAAGTSDAIILADRGEELQVHDLKYGQGVQVWAEENEQLMMYALGALKACELLGQFKRIRMVIHQPRLNHLSEWDCTVEELLVFKQKAGNAAYIALEIMNHPVRFTESAEMRLTPGDKQCRFCKAKATCPALRDFSLKTVVGKFDDLTALPKEISKATEEVKDADNETLAALMPVLDQIIDWAKAVRGRAEAKLLAGEKIRGWKLVQGKRGNRAWVDKDEVEQVLKSMRYKIDEMYSLTLISPTQAEKLIAKDNPRRWKKLQEHVTQSEGVPHVAPESDKRPAIQPTPVAESFANLAEGEDLA